MFQTKLVVLAVVSLVLSFVGSVAAQVIEPPEIEWKKTFGNQDTDEGVASLQITTDGGFIFAGKTRPFIGVREYYYLIKTDKDGNKLWEKTFDGINPNFSPSMNLTDDGCYIIVGGASGRVSRVGGVYLIKTDKDGNKLWEKTFGIEYNFSVGSFVQQTKDGGYIIIGTTSIYINDDTFHHDMYLIKTDGEGNKIWEKTIGWNTTDEWGRSLQQTIDGGYIIIGLTEPTGWRGRPESRGYIIKTDSQGNKIWEKILSEPNEEYNSINSVQQTIDGGYIFTGKIDLIDKTGNYIYLIKTDTLGKIQWKKLFSSKKEVYSSSFGFGIKETKDGGYIIVGGTSFLIKFGDSVALGYFGYLVRTDYLGNIIWEKIIEGIKKDAIMAFVQLTSDGGYIIAGRTGDFSVEYSSDAYLVKLTPDSILPIVPENVSAQLRPTQSAKVSWKNTAKNVEKFILEKKAIAAQGGGGAVENNDWQFLAEILSDKDTYIDPVLPPSQEISYRVSAVNANGKSAPSQPATITTPNDFRVQMKIFDPAKGIFVNFSSEKFNPEYGTAVLVHGYNIHGGLDINYESPGNEGEILKLGKAIRDRVKNVNVLAWDWLSEAAGNDATRPVPVQIKLLTGKLKTVFTSNGKTYDKSVHYIGNSLGAYIVAGACDNVLNWFSSKKITPQPCQVTLLDPADIGFMFDLTVKVTALRRMNAYIDLYHGFTSFGNHNANIRIDVPQTILCSLTGKTIPAVGYLTCHKLPQLWYIDSIPINEKIISLRVNNTCSSEGMVGTLGFGTSILLADETGKNINRPQSENCEASGTMMFRKISNCGDVEVYGLDNPNNCEVKPLPEESPFIDWSFGSFYHSENARCETCNADLDSIMLFLSQNRDGGSGGGAIEEMKVGYALNLEILPEWDYMGLEYDFTSAPSPADLNTSIVSGNETLLVFSINSDAVFNDGFLDSGMIDIQELKGKHITLQIELVSIEYGASINIQNLSFWKDFWNNNHKPIADAGPDQVVIAGDNNKAIITLDGSRSSDEDGEELQYRWIYHGELIGAEKQITKEFSGGRYNILLLVEDGADNIAEDVVTIEVKIPFLRGDSNTDGEIDISDGVNTLSWLFLGTGKVSCKDSSDTNDDGNVDIADAVSVLSFLFIGGKEPKSPYPELGYDITDDTLDCQEYIKK